MLDERTVNLRLGMAFQVAMQGGCMQPAAVLASEWLRAIRLDQCCFAFDQRLEPVAFWTWARPGAIAAARLTQSPAASLRPWEWNEGGALWLMHLVHCNYRVRDVLLYIRTHLARTGEPIHRRRMACASRSAPTMRGLPRAAYVRRTADCFTQTLQVGHFGPDMPSGRP